MSHVGALSGGDPTLLILLRLIWGIAIVADSARFSASIAELADPQLIETMLTVQAAAGFGKDRRRAALAAAFRSRPDRAIVGGSMEQLPTTDRRRVLAGIGAVASLLTLGHSTQAFAGSAGFALSAWVERCDELAASLRGETISVADWRRGIETVLSRVALSEVLRDLDFARLRAGTGFAERGVATAKVAFAGGGSRRLRFHPKLFAVDRGRAIVPHGHANMVSAHLVLGGRFRLRQYDQLGRDAATLIVRPTLDREIAPGDLSTIGETLGNVHWFVAQEPAHTFDVIVTGLDLAAERRFDIFNLDMERARSLGDGRLRVPRIGVAEALARYG